MAKPRAAYVQVAFKRGTVYTVEGPSGKTRRLVFQGRLKMMDTEVLLFTPKKQFTITRSGS